MHDANDAIELSEHLVNQEQAWPPRCGDKVH